MKKNEDGKGKAVKDGGINSKQVVDGPIVRAIEQADAEDDDVVQCLSSSSSIRGGRVLPVIIGQITQGDDVRCPLAAAESNALVRVGHPGSLTMVRNNQNYNEHSMFHSDCDACI